MNTKVEKDFGDWLSPMLVKEIRQGFRSKVFVSAFLLIQGLMIFCVIMSLILSAGDFTDSSTGLFWIMIGIPLILLMPLHGFGVLGSEIKGNTMELLFLTRLSAWRIVAGKWTAIVAQTLLIVCSVLPYTVLRYFVGGVNLLMEMEALALMLIWSALLTGVCVALSPFYRSMVARMFLPIFLVVIVIIGFSAYSASRFTFATGGSVSLFTTFLYMGILGPLFLLLMFEIAVARIAPPAENHSFRKRFLAFVILAAIALLNKFTHGTEALFVVGFILLLPVCITSLCEEIKPIPSIYLPFIKRGLPGRIASWIFSPGWAPGMLFVFICIASYIAIFYKPGSLDDIDVQMSIVCFTGALLTPLAITKLFFDKFKKTFVVYLSVQVFMFISMIIAGTLKNTVLSDWMKLVSPLPTSVFFLNAFGKIDDIEKPFYTATSAFALAVTVFILIFKSVDQWRQVRVLEKQARENLMKPKAPEAPIVHANAA